jgi:hypothetical protein
MACGDDGQVVGAAVAHAPFFVSKISFAESNCGLSAHMNREGDPQLSAKGPSPAGLHREALPLGEGSASCSDIQKPFTERIPALGEGPESCSDIQKPT